MNLRGVSIKICIFSIRLFLAILITVQQIAFSYAEAPAENATPALDPVSSEICLDGNDWLFQKIIKTPPETLSEAPPIFGWTGTKYPATGPVISGPITVPGYLLGWKYERAWFKKTFTITAEQKTSVMKLRFNGVKYNCKIYLNGADNENLVGGYPGGYEPFEVDVSSHIVVGENTLYVGVYDWTGTFTEPAFSQAPVDLSGTTNISAQTKPGTFNSVISAIGNFYYYYGIWDSVYLLSCPEVNIEDVFVKTSVQYSRVSLEIALKNNNPYAQGITVRNSILDVNNSVVMILPEAVLSINAASQETVMAAANWSSPILWSPMNPYRYKIKSEIVHTSSGRVLDEKITLFGFREFRCEGKDFLLNGIKIKLMGTSNPPPTVYMTESEITTVLSKVKEGNNIVFRLHCQPWPELWYEIADKIGLLIIEESAYFGNSWRNNKYSDPEFWENFKTHLRGMIRKGRNHPSIIMWSLENELQHIGNNHDDIESKLADLARYVKGRGDYTEVIDDTRPIYFEADKNPGDEADVIGIHYPHEFPENYAYPNTADWTQVNRPGMYIDGFQWDKTSPGAKPLYIGEFGWSYTWLSDAVAIMFGNDAYNDPMYYRANTFIWGYYRNKARSYIWEKAIACYRENEVSGISPWNIFDDASIDARDKLKLNLDENTPNLLYDTQKRAFEPIRFFVKNVDKTFFAGRSIVRNVVIHNDVPEGSNLRLEWSVNNESQDPIRFYLAPGELVNKDITFDTPGVSDVTSLSLNLKLYKEGASNDTLAFEETQSFKVYPENGISASFTGKKIGLYNTSSSTQAILGRYCVPVADLSNIPTDLDLLIVGSRSFTGSEDLSALNLLMEGGMNVLILDQEFFPPALPLDLKLVDAPATWVFRAAATSPALKDITDADLRYWRGDNYVLEKNIVNPSHGNYKVILESGNYDAKIYSPVGINFSPIIEVPVAAGKYIFSQMLLCEKFREEPIANILLNNLINYSLIKKLPYAQVGLYADNTAMKQYLDIIGLEYSVIDPSSNLSGYQLLIFSGTEAVWQNVQLNSQNITAFLDGGGTLLLHRLNAASFVRISDVLRTASGPLDAKYQMKDVSLYPVIKGEDDEVNAGLSNYDLCWLTPGYQLKQGIIDSVLVEKYNITSPVSPLEAEAFHNKSKLTKSDGKSIDGGQAIVVAGSAGWQLNACGFIEEESVDFATTSQYTFGITALGTQAYGVYPIMVVKIDGKVYQRFYVDSASWQDYAFTADLVAGRHTLRLEFVNFAVDTTVDPDAYRRLVIDKVKYGASVNDGEVKALTMPAALTKIKKGAGQIIIDNIKWENETDNPKRVERYVSSILTNLGCKLGKTVIENYAPVLQSIGSKVVDQNYNLTFVVNATDPDSDTLTYSAVGLPQGASLDPSTGTFSWTPDRTQGGSHSVTFQVDDGSLSDSETITISARQPNLTFPSNAIVYSPQPSTEGDRIIITTSIINIGLGKVSGVPISYRIGKSGLPKPDTALGGKTIGETTPLLSGEKEAFSFDWQTKIGDAGQYIIYIDIDPENIVTESKEADNFAAKAFSVSNVTYHTVTASAGDNGSIDPAGSVIIDRGLSKTFNITPSANYHVIDVLVDGASVGAVTSYTFSNVIAGHTIEATFGNTKPTSCPQSVVTPEDTAKEIILLGSDPENAPLEYSIIDSPAHGTLTGAAPNMTYTPSADYNGPDSFTYKVNDGAASSAASTVSIAVTPVNDIPALDRIDNKSVEEGSVLNITLSSADPDNDVISYSKDENSVGTLSGDTFTYMPTLDEAGDKTVTFTATDGSLSSSETITIKVNNVNNERKFTIKAVVCKGGRISPAGNLMVDYGQNQTFTITAERRYYIADVVVDGVSVGATGTYTFENISADHRIKARFTRNKHKGS